MKRKLIIALLCAAAALLQTTLMGYIEIASIRPNLQVILATSFALMCGSKTGLTVGALAGFFLDLVSGSTPGFYTLAYAWIGYLTGFSYRIFYDDDIKTPLLPDPGTDSFFLLSQKNHNPGDDLYGDSGGIYLPAEFLYQQEDGKDLFLKKPDSFRTVYDFKRYFFLSEAVIE